jgi:K+-transporting ATPase KdpC subunit
MKNLKIGIKIFAVLFIILGVIYPLIVTGVAQVFFKNKANGSIIYLDNKAVGSKLIGQPFEGKQFFWPRPSATQDFPYNALDSGGSNLGPPNPTLIKEVEKTHKLLKRKWHEGSNTIVFSIRFIKRFRSKHHAKSCLCTNSSYIQIHKHPTTSLRNISKEKYS